MRAKITTDEVEVGGVVDIVWEVPNIFAAGDYSISVACCDQSATRFYDWLNEAATFSIKREDATAGAVDPMVKVSKYAVTR